MVAALAALVLIVPATSQAFKVKTNRGGSCVVDPVTVVQGDQVTYGLKVRKCRTRNGVKRIASQGLAIEGIEVVSALDRKIGPAPYTNLRSSPRTLPAEGVGDLLPDVPVVPDIPDVPLVPDLPVDIPSLPDLPLPGGGDGSVDPDATYTRIDYSLRLKRDRGRRAKRKPEKWRKRSGCRRVTTKRTNDTLICQSFADTS